MYARVPGYGSYDDNSERIETTLFVAFHTENIKKKSLHFIAGHSIIDKYYGTVFDFDSTGD